MAKKAEAKGFVFYNDWADILRALDSKEEIGKLMLAVMELISGNEPQPLTGAVKLAYIVISAQIRRDREKYAETVRRCSASGKKGGAPKGNRNAAKKPAADLSENDPKQPKQANKKTNSKTNTKTTANTSDNTNADESTTPSAADGSGAVTAPALEDIMAYCRERNSSVDPEHFYDYYTSNGWQVGRCPMRDWKAAVRSWEKNGIAGYRSDRDNAKKAPPNKGKRKEPSVLITDDEFTEQAEAVWKQLTDKYEL